MGKFFILLVPLCLTACISGGDAQSVNGPAIGGAGVDVEVYKSNDMTHWEAGPGGSRKIRQEYKSSISNLCHVGVDICLMPVAGPIGERCYCQDRYGNQAFGNIYKEQPTSWNIQATKWGF